MGLFGVKIVAQCPLDPLRVTSTATLTVEDPKAGATLKRTDALPVIPALVTRVNQSVGP
jgi:hypothetical protein